MTTEELFRCSTVRPLRPPPSLPHARSWLLVAGARTSLFGSAHSSSADAVVLDLEDGVVPRSRPAARQAVRRWFADGGSAWVRINSAETDDWSKDVEVLDSSPGLRGVVLAKCESRNQIEATADRLPRDIPIIALIESALGIERAFDIASSPHTLRLAFGSGDFRRDTGASTDAAALAYARGRLVVASRAAGLPGPIDGPTIGDGDGDGDAQLIADLGVTTTMGMSGKLCMHPGQAAVINRELSPATADIGWARTVISELGADGAHVKDGSDLPKLARAHTIQRLASVYSISG